MSFNVLGVKISSNQNRTHDVSKQADKAGRDVIFNNKNMCEISKVKIYKTCVLPFMTQGIETRADKKRTESVLRMTKINILRTISGYKG